MKKNQVAFVDVDTQFDFMHPEGNLYVPGAKEIVPNLEKLVYFARTREIPLIASADAHTVDDPEFKLFPLHCVKGEPGQQKIDATTVKGALCVGIQPQKLDMDPVNAVVVEKTVFDMFANPNIDQVLETTAAKEYIVFGVATDYCVKAAALGLRRRGYDVEVVTDAVRPVTEEGGRQALAEMQAAGIRFTTTAEVVQDKDSSRGSE